MNDTVEVVTATDVGPRVLRYSFLGEQNIFAEVPKLTTPTELGEWKPWGGHRLWAAPERMPSSYAPDNEPVEFRQKGDLGIDLIQPPDKSGIQKKIGVELAAHGSGVKITHEITNRNSWPIELAAWASTIMRGGGVTIIPQEPYRSHDEYLAPSRPLVLWHFTQPGNHTIKIGNRFICLESDPSSPDPQKIGVLNKQEWCAYWSDQTLFVKMFSFREGGRYPDYGCNNEAYTAGSYVEVESLGALICLQPGATVGHMENWHLFKDVDIGEDEDRIQQSIAPLVSSILKEL